MSKIGIITMMLDGSKRFPGKATHSFLGKPLYTHTVDFAKRFYDDYGYPYVVMHNIPSVVLPEWVIECGRGKDRENISKEILSLRLDWDIYILLQVTSPMRSFVDIVDALTAFEKDESFLCAVTVKSLKEKYVHNHWGHVNYDQNDRTYSYGAIRTSIAYETGSVFFFRKAQLHRNHILTADALDTMLIEDRFAIDIDYKEDLDEAERKWEHGQYHT